MLLAVGGDGAGRALAREMGGDALRFVALAAVAFGIGRARRVAPLASGLAAAVLTGVIGSVLYGAGLRARGAPAGARAGSHAASREGVTATLRPWRAAPAPAPATPPSGAPRPAQGPATASVVACLLAAFALITVLTWRKWGNPEIDAGAELSTADLVSHGSVPYQDVRYFYGPLGLYGLAATFKVFGASFTVAYAFGLAQAGGDPRGLLRARPPLAAAPHGWARAPRSCWPSASPAPPSTSSCRTRTPRPSGILCLLLQLLALSHRRVGLAGLAAGLVCLTRPEFAAVAAGVGVAWVIGTLRDDGLRAALRAAAWLAVPAVVVAGGVLGVFAAVVGTERLVTENLWPVDFIRVAGFRSQSHWMPFDLASAAGLVARAAIYLGGLAAVVAAAERWRMRRGASRASPACWPLAAAFAGLALVDAAARATGVFGETRIAVEGELRHLLIGMSWLPALALGATAWARRPVRPPAARAAVGLVGARPRAAGGGCCARPARLQRVHDRGLVRPVLRGAARAARRDPAPARRRAPPAGRARPSSPCSGAVAVGLSAYALAGLYADASYAVHTPRGTFVTEAARRSGAAGGAGPRRRHHAPG